MFVRHTRDFRTHTTRGPPFAFPSAGGIINFADATTFAHLPDFLFACCCFSLAPRCLQKSKEFAVVATCETLGKKLIFLMMIYNLESHEFYYCFLIILICSCHFHGSCRSSVCLFVILVPFWRLRWQKITT